MKALCWHGKGDIRFETVPDPKIENPRDAIIKLSSTVICGSDLHIYGGSTWQYAHVSRSELQPCLRVPTHHNDSPECTRPHRRLAIHSSPRIWVRFFSYSSGVIRFSSNKRLSSTSRSSALA